MKAVADVSGISATAFTILMNDSFFNPTAYKSPARSPYQHIKPKHQTTRSDVFLKKAMDMCKSGLLHKNYGLSMLDLLQMDNTTLNTLDKHLEETAKEQLAATANITNVFKEQKHKSSSRPTNKGEPG